MADVRPLIWVEQNSIITRDKIGPAGNTWKALKSYVNWVIFPVCILRQMVVEAVVHLKGVVQGLQVINEVGSPICDVDDELLIIKSDTPIIYF